jgi:hypothetical protein
LFPPGYPTFFDVKFTLQQTVTASQRKSSPLSPGREAAAPMSVRRRIGSLPFILPALHRSRHKDGVSEYVITIQGFGDTNLSVPTS